MQRGDGRGQAAKGGGGAVCSVQDYFRNTVGAVQINIAAKGGGRRHNAGKHALRNI